MSHGSDIDGLIAELVRVGVDPETVSAGLALGREELLRALHSLPDGAGPVAFLHLLHLLHLVADDSAGVNAESA